jgi:hypothetical protein
MWDVDLSAQQEALAKFVGTLRYFYVDLCNFESARDNPGPRPVTHRDPNPWVRDEDGNEWTIEDWEQLRRKRGRPANDPLQFIYRCAREYWNYEIGLSRWSPQFEQQVVGECVPINACARFLVAVAQQVDQGWTVANCHSVHDRERRERHSPEAHERRRAKRRTYQQSSKVRARRIANCRE